MCLAVALPASELPTALLGGASVTDRVHCRGGEPEVRFYWRARPALLPVWWHGRLHVVRWGNRDRAERRLPPTGWTWRATVEAGRWAALAPEPVDVPAKYIFMIRGVGPRQAGGAGPLGPGPGGRAGRLRRLRTEHPLLPGYDPERVDAGTDQRGPLSREVSPADRVQHRPPTIRPAVSLVPDGPRPAATISPAPDSSSPNDPTFFLHHCQVDRIWAAWQRQYPTAAYVPDMTAPATLQFHRIDDALYSLFEESVTPRDMLDYTTRYQYDTLADLVTP